MSSLVSSAPALQEKDVKQIAALPLGGRIKLDAWSDQLSIKKTQPVRLMSASEKMPFQITPMFPYLTRTGQPAPGQTDTSSSAKAATPPQREAEVKAAETPSAQPPPR